MAIASIYGAQKLGKQQLGKNIFLENHKKLNLLNKLSIAGIFLVPEAFNFKKYKQLAETTEINDFELRENKYYFFQPNLLTKSL